MRITHIEREWAAVRYNGKAVSIEIMAHGNRAVLLKPGNMGTAAFRRIAPIVKKRYVQKYGG